MTYEGIFKDVVSKVTPENNIVLWGDSDIPYSQKLSDPRRMENSISMGILNLKIGSSITDKVQPMDIDSGFKVMKTTARRTMYIISFSWPNQKFEPNIGLKHYSTTYGTESRKSSALRIYTIRLYNINGCIKGA